MPATRSSTRGSTPGPALARATSRAPGASPSPRHRRRGPVPARLGAPAAVPAGRRLPGDEIVAYCHIGQQAPRWSSPAACSATTPDCTTAHSRTGPGETTTRWKAAWPNTKARPDVHRGAGGADASRTTITLIDLRSDLNAYLANHLPGAVYLHYETLRAAANGVPGDVLPAASYAELWSRIGIRRDRPVVIYASGDAPELQRHFPGLAPRRIPPAGGLRAGRRLRQVGRERNGRCPGSTPRSRR